MTHELQDREGGGKEDGELPADGFTKVRDGMDAAKTPAETLETPLGRLVFVAAAAERLGRALATRLRHKRKGVVALRPGLQSPLLVAARGAKPAYTRTVLSKQQGSASLSSPLPGNEKDVKRCVL